MSTRTGLRFFLCGDVMTGRGIDQILRHPCDPALHEDYAQSAMDYVRLAETANGPIPRGAEPAYIWGAALEELDRTQPNVRLINLETSITRSEDYLGKGINYRMSPENADCLKATAIDCCVLGNNHILDWGPRGLLDTLTTLERLQIKSSGAGKNLAQASAPAALTIAENRRVLVFSFASPTSGIPRNWAATAERAGVNLLTDFSEQSISRIVDDIAGRRRAGDLIVVSIHWGGNWGHDIPTAQQRLAHALIDRADVSIIHGHSSHHPKALEVYRNRLILYGCGDFLNDYEGIKGYEEYRDDLVLMYLADIEPAGTLASLEIVPLQIRNFRLTRPSKQDMGWMQRTLEQQYRRFGAGIMLDADVRFSAFWKPAS